MKEKSGILDSREEDVRRKEKGGSRTWKIWNSLQEKKIF